MRAKLFIQCGTIFLLTILISACGGGGSGDGGGEPPANQPPVVSISPSTIKEMTTSTLTASATDSDGSITAYAWSQKSGMPLVLQSTDQLSIIFTTPDVEQDETAVLSLTVTDNDGAEGTAEVTLTIQATSAFSVQGRVTDNPVPNAQIRFTIGDETFETTADTEGRYSIDLAPGLSLEDTVVRAEATAPSANSQLKLVSLLGSVSELKHSAGEDGILTRNENLNVNITNITTAIAGMIAQDFPEGVATGRDLADAKKALLADQALRTAASIKLILDYDFDMPAGISDTFAFSSDLNASASFTESAQVRQPDVYNEALQQMSEDPDLFASTLSANTADTYYFFYPSITTSLLFGNGYSEIMNRLTLNGGGSGEISIGPSREITWTDSESGIILSDPGKDIRISYEYKEELGYSVAEITVLRINRLQWLDSTDSSANFLVEAETFKHYPDGELPDSEPAALPPFAMIGIRSAGIEHAAKVLQLDKDYSMVVARHSGEVVNFTESVDPFFEVSAQEMKFSGTLESGGNVALTIESISGNGTQMRTQSVASWHIDNRGHLVVTDSEENISKFIFLNDDPLKPRVWALGMDRGIPTMSAGNALLKETSSWITQDVVGIYRHVPQFMEINNPFWFEIYEDGTAMTVSVYDADNSGTIEDDEKTLMPGLWKINSDGNFLIRRYLGNSGFCASTIWDPEVNADCSLYHEREWQLQSINLSDTYWLKHYHRFFIDYVISAFPDAPPGEHLLDNASTFNIEFEKVENRPLPLPIE